MKRGWWLLVVVALATAATVAGVATWRSTRSAPAQTTDSTGTDRHRTRAIPAPPQSRVAGDIPVSARSMLPDLDAPLNQVVNQLEPRAERGDAAAACRLAAEAVFCRNIVSLPPVQFERLLAQAAADAGETVEAAARRVAWEVEHRRGEYARCMRTPLHQRAPYLDLRAAKLGDSDAALRFLAGEYMSPGAMVADPRLVDTYRQHAMALFIRLVEEGDDRVVSLWVQATHPIGWPPLAGVLEGHWADPAVAAAVAEQIGMRRLEVEISPAAAATADALYTRHFAHAATVPDGNARASDVRKHCERWVVP